MLVTDTHQPLCYNLCYKVCNLSVHSEYSERDDYKSRNLGSRNGRVRDVSYAEATQKLEEMGLRAEAWLHEVRHVCTQMELILEEIPPEQAAAARALQAALIELVDDAGDDDDGFVRALRVRNRTKIPDQKRRSHARPPSRLRSHSALRPRAAASALP